MGFDILPIRCPHCGISEHPDKFAIDMFRNAMDKIVTLNQCELCKGIWTDV